MGLASSLAREIFDLRGFFVSIELPLFGAIIRDKSDDAGAPR